MAYMSVDRENEINTRAIYESQEYYQERFEYTEPTK